VARPRARRTARAGARRRRAEANVARARRVARRGGHPRRGGSPGAAAGSDVRPCVDCGARDDSGMSDVKFDVSDDPARACASALTDAAVAGAHVVLTGGSTPRAAYEAVPKDVWDGVTVWFGDERCVAPDDERSNYRLAHATLLDPIAAAGGRPTIHRMQGELGPETGADAYEALLAEAGHPQFDLLLLGLGPDGHCASLFPDQATVNERSRWVVGVER